MAGLEEALLESVEFGGADALLERAVVDAPLHAGTVRRDLTRHRRGKDKTYRAGAERRHRREGCAEPIRMGRGGRRAG